MSRLDAVVALVAAMCLAWAAYENMTAAAVHAEARYTLERIDARKVDPATAYYGERTDRLPCCPTLNRWR